MSYQDDFVAADGIYLLNHSVGRPLANTADVWNENFLYRWQSSGEQVWPEWLAEIDKFRNALATLLGGQQSGFCPQVNLSSALTKVIPALPIAQEKRTILYTEHDFPSMGYVFQQAARSGFKLKQISAQQDCLDLDHWESALDDSVGLVLISHVHSNYGRQVPVAEICRLARSKGAISVVDVAQSIGVVPIDLDQWGADVVLGSCVKWLCGGPGAGFLWMQPELLLAATPTDVGWFSHEDPFEFDINQFRYASDALRFLGGTPSVQPYVIAANSIQYFVEVGVEKIRAHNLALNNQLIDVIPEEALATPSEADKRGGTLVLKLEADSQANFCDKLRQAKVAFDERPTGIRISPHIYNTAQEIDQVVQALRSSL